MSAPRTAVANQSPRVLEALAFGLHLELQRQSHSIHLFSTNAAALYRSLSLAAKAQSEVTFLIGSDSSKTEALLAIRSLRLLFLNARKLDWDARQFRASEASARVLDLLALAEERLAPTAA